MDISGAAPGSTYAYSNFGFALLGLALEQVFNKPYEEIVSDLTTQLDCPGMAMQAAEGNKVQGRRLKGTLVEPWELNAFAPVGGCWSTLKGLSTFAQRHIVAPRPEFLTTAMSDVGAFTTHAPPGSAIPRSAVMGLAAAGIEALTPTAFFLPLICVEIAALGGGIVGGGTAALGWELATALERGSWTLMGERLLYSLFAIGLGLLTTSSKQSQEMALGWHIGWQGDHRYAWHNGMTSGFSSYMRVDPYEKGAVVILAGSAGSPNLYSEVFG